MNFQSADFIIFFTVFFFLFWTVAEKIVLRNILMLGAGMFLYSLWDYRFFLLLMFQILLNYLSGKYISKDSKQGKAVFYSAVVLNLLPLIFFKYWNFFIVNINDLSSIFGLNVDLTTFKLLLPFGISFYTFLSLSYIIDIYKKQISPEKSLINYAVSISYFPIILSGPIHRPRIFLEQLKEKKRFEYSLAAEGLRQILTGLFYKIVIADTIAKHADKVFGDYDSFSGLTLLTGSVYFSFQLYFDFNGYSEMAIGISKLLGFRIERNFKFPYLSRTITDFWKRWHISLTQWFRDYIFLPLSYSLSRKVKQGSVFDSDMFIYSSGIFFTWALTGFWHGAGWTFILWGMTHAVLLIINKGFFKRKKRILKKLGLKKDSMSVVVYESVLTFALVNFAWIFFRSETPGKGFEIIGCILNVTEWSIPEVSFMPLFLIAFVLLLEFLQSGKEFLFEILGFNIVYRWLVYITVLIAVLYFSGNDSTFIYAGF